jgi:hypothetical protein
MKKRLLFGMLGITAIGLFCAFLIAGLVSPDVKPITNNTVNKNTSLCIINCTNDTVLTYITLGSVGDTNYVQNTFGVFGVLDSAVQTSFYLLPYDTINYISPVGKGINGNITFGYAPQNCPDTTQTPDGINLFEFNLNDNFLVNAQETIDISCVSGVNSFMQVAMIDGGLWNNGIDTVLFFLNGSLYNNLNQSGVYPFGCDSCVGITKKTPYCSGHKPYAKPQSKNICNIQRNASSFGGTVFLKFAGFCKKEKLN